MYLIPVVIPVQCRENDVIINLLIKKRRIEKIALFILLIYTSILLYVY